MVATLCTLICTFSLYEKALSLEKTQINLAFCALIRTLDRWSR